MGNEIVDINQLLQVTQNTAMNVNGLSQQMGVVSNKLVSIDKRVSSLETNFETFKNNEILNSSQRRNIPRAVKARVSHLLKIKWSKGKPTKECESDYFKYYKGFIARLYSDAKNYAKMADDYRDTKQVDYEGVMEYIESWKPSSGVEEHKRYLDRMHRTVRAVA